MKTAMITGITGQDGSYLAKLLLDKGYKVVGLTRGYNEESLNKLKYLQVADQVVIEECDLLDISSIIRSILKYKPDEVYNLAAQSSVGVSFSQPIGTISFNTMSVLNLLETIRTVKPDTKFYHASSSEMYGKVNELPITENSVLHPLSPYAISKASAHWTVINYRESYGLFACCGIFFNHESFLRNKDFFIKKVISGALRIRDKRQDVLKIGNIDIKRDFGYSPKYVEAMYLMLQQDISQDFIICSGESVSLREIIYYIFDKFNLDRGRIVVDNSLYRPSEIHDIYGDNNKARKILNWHYNMSFFEVLDILIDEEEKILFDGTIISSGWAKNSHRSGIFFASSNILKEFLKHPELDISLYCSPDSIRKLRTVLQDDFAEYPDLEIINENEAGTIEIVQDRFTIAKINAKTTRLKLKFLSYLSFFVKAIAILQNRFYHSKALKRRANEFDIYFSPGYLAPEAIRKNKKLKRYILLYDTIPLLFPNFSIFMKYFGYSWTKTLVDNLEQDDYGFSISEQTKSDFLVACPRLIPEKIVVTPLAASGNFYHCRDNEKIVAVKKKYNIPSDKKYIFSLCTLDPRKNLLMAVKCFLTFIRKNEIDDLFFVLSGDAHDHFAGTIEKEFNGVGKYADRIIKTGYIDDEDLAPLYSNAEFFVYPSLYEGFGLPPLEAMQCGTPVITSNTSSLPEVVGDAGILVDPKSEVELVDAMKKLYFNEELRRDYLEKGLERAKQFSWKKCVDTMVKEIINN